jgi:predicted CoA-binding protein
MNQEALTKTMLEAETWAVVGVNADPGKFGHRIYQTLKKHGYRVYAVNPTCKDIGGDACYPDLSSLPVRPDVIDMVVSPRHGAGVIEEAGKLGIPYVWFQPGSHEPELADRAEALGMTVLRHCVLVALDTR